MKPVDFRGTAALILIFGMMLITRCDSSFVPDVEPPLSEVRGERVEAVKEWYQTALSKEQSTLPVLPDGAAGRSPMTVPLLRYWMQWFASTRQTGITWKYGAMGMGDILLRRYWESMNQRQAHRIAGYLSFVP